MIRQDSKRQVASKKQGAKEGLSRTADPQGSKPQAVFSGRLKKLVAQARGRRFVFLLVGRTGVGKSSTVNTLMGRDGAEVGKFRPTSFGVTAYEAEVEKVKYLVIDTPGLFDARGDSRGYINKIKREAAEIDCVWFLTRLDENRVGDDEVRSIGLITSAFGKAVWERALIVFTHADKVEAEEYKEYIRERTTLVREVIAEKSGDKRLASSIPAVAISNRGEETPDGRPWLGELYTKVVSRISKHGALPFLLATARRVRPASRGKGGSKRAVRKDAIELSPEQKREVRASIEKKIDFGDAVSLAIAGATIGGAFGPVGAAIGGSVGALGALLAWLSD